MAGTASNHPGAPAAGTQQSQTQVRKTSLFTYPPAKQAEVVLYIEILYLLALFVLAIIYFISPHSLVSSALPNSFGSLPIGVPWFGALGAVIISLSGAVAYQNDWNPNLTAWHLTRPLMGASLAIIAVLIFQAGILATASSPNPSSAQSLAVPSNLLYYLIAFIVGYREEVFRSLIKKVADVILTPGESVPHPVIRQVDPPGGKAQGGEPVTITGSGFTGTRGVKFGSTLSKNAHVDSDSQITAITPPGTQGTASVSVTTRSGSVTSNGFTYE